MYIRPQLSRKKTENREILYQEHFEDVELCNQTLEKGKGFECDSFKVLGLIEKLSANKEIFEKDKKTILECLSSILEEIESEYDHNIQNTLADIEFSIRDRIDEMEVATKRREHESYETERTMWKTDFINKDKLVVTSWEVYQQYYTLLENAKSDLSNLTKVAMEQRNKILERRGKR